MLTMVMVEVSPPCAQTRGTVAINRVLEQALLINFLDIYQDPMWNVCTRRNQRCFHHRPVSHKLFDAMCRKLSYKFSQQSV